MFSAFPTPIKPLIGRVSPAFSLRRRALLGMACAALAVPGGVWAQAAPYPNRPLHFVVPFGAGGTSDQVARLLGARLAERLGQAVVIENKPGAGTALGLMAVRAAAPDGYTLLLGGTSGVVNQALDKSVGYHVQNDFSAVSIIGEVPYVMVVNAQVPAKNITDLVGLLKADPSKYNYASGGMGSSNHFATELFLNMTGARATHVPYNSSALAIGSILSGETHFGFDTPVTAKPHVVSGKLRALATSTPRRAAAMPEVPTLSESGVPGFAVTGFFAVVVPARTPREVIDRLNREINAVMDDPELRSRLLPAGFETGKSTPQEADRRFATELERWSKMAVDLKLQK